MLLSIITWFIIGFGAIFAMVAVIIMIQTGKSRKLCIEKIQAQVVDLEEEKVKDSSHGYAYTTFYPVYQYTYQGNIYERRSGVGHPGNKIAVGQVRYIYVNPRNPKQIHEDTNIYAIVTFVFLAIGIVFLAVGIILKCIFLFM